MPIVFLIVSVIGLLFTLNAFRPLRVEAVSLPVFFAGWLTSEMPLHHLAWQVIATAVFAAVGALDGAPGRIGLAIAVASWVGLVVLAVQASRTKEVLEAALAGGLGDDYRDRMAPQLGVGEAHSPAWSRLVFPFLMRDPDVEVIRNISYRASDGGRAHQLDIYRNRAHATGSPVLLYLHGGGWVVGDKRQQGIPLILHLAAHGWLCVTANYRLSPKATFPDHLIDAKSALTWIKSHVAEYGGDPSFVVVAGGSAGGHLAALVALTPNDPAYQPGFETGDTTVAAAVPLYGVYDFTNRDGLRGPGMGRLLERSVMKLSLRDDPRAYQLASPMDRITEAAPPFLVIHGANDSLVPVKEARRFAELLRDQSSSEVVYAELPGAQHAFEVFRSVRTAHLVRAAASFLAVVYGASTAHLRRTESACHRRVGESKTYDDLTQRQIPPGDGPP